MVMEVKWSEEVKCEQGFTTGIWYTMEYNDLDELEWVYISGLRGSKSKNQIMNRRIVSRWAEKHVFVFRFWYGEGLILLFL